MGTQDGQELCLHAARHKFVVTLVAAWLRQTFVFAHFQHSFDYLKRDIQQAPLAPSVSGTDFQFSYSGHLQLDFVRVCLLVEPMNLLFKRCRRIGSMRMEDVDLEVI